MTWVVRVGIKVKVFGYESQQGRRLTEKFQILGRKIVTIL